MQCRITNSLTIGTLADVKGKLAQALAGDGPFELDTREVTEIDMAGVQLLLAALKSAATARIPIDFCTDLQGPAISASFRLLGLAEHDWKSGT